MLILKCPTCKEILRLENTAGGANVACGCGAEYKIPNAPPAGDFFLCPACGHLCENEAKLCSECSWSFVFFRKTDDYDPEAELRALIAKRKKAFLIRLGVFVVPVLFAALFWLICCSGSPIGVSSQNPLGVLSGDHTLFGLPFTELSEKHRFGEAVRVFQYRPDPKKKGPHESILLVVGPKNKLLFVSCHYVEFAQSVALTGTPVLRFLMSFSEAVGLPGNLESISRSEGVAPFQYTVHETVFENDAFRYKKTSDGLGLGGLTSGSNRCEFLATGYHLPEPEAPVFSWPMGEDDREDGEDTPENSDD